MADAKVIPTEAVDWVERFHAAVDEVARPVAAANASRLACRPGCAGCCVDDLTVFDVEAEVIRRHHRALLERGVPHPPGSCAFLDGEGRCRVYAQRPYVCRTQGLPLRWLERDEDDAIVEGRDICPENVAGGAPLEELEADACWTIGPFEERLAARQADGKRTALRDLFEVGTKRRRLPVV